MACCKPLQASPDFKGIKTIDRAAPAAASGFKPALISKGLRLVEHAAALAVDGFKPALISKGLRLDFDRVGQSIEASSQP